MPITTPSTLFSRDILGRYVCNTFDEAVQSGPFDVVVIGGGTFGLTLASDLYFRSKRSGTGTIPQDGFRPVNHRILVLEAGPFTVPEHVQDLPSLGLGNPGTQPSAAVPLPATRQGLIAQGIDKLAVLEVWGLPWNSTERFGGLAYCVGGRSVYFGGWSPQFLDTEMASWPPAAVEDLKARYFSEAAEQTGASASNDFLNGPLHEFFRDKLFQIYGSIPHAVPLAELPDYTGSGEVAKLDAPLAVQSAARPGFFPFNKFSSVPLAIAAARDAYGESGGNDAAKRLMVVPNCHVKSLRTRTYTVGTGAVVRELDGVDTGNGFLDLSGTLAGNPNRRPVVVLALGAIESARLALLSLAGIPNADQIGKNLMVHVRKNANFRAALPNDPGLRQRLQDLELAVLLVRCRTTINNTPVHFHCQITASAMPAGAGAGSADALLFRKVPDLDSLRFFTETPPGEVDVSIRVVGEMLPNLANNMVTLPLAPPDNDEYTVPRASVSVARGPEDAQLQQRMDQVIQFLAQQVFGATTPVAIPPADGLGTTFHESGTLRMGDDPARSVVNADLEFHHVTNLYAGDGSVLPACGSANPVMSGVALCRRLAKRLAPEGDGGRSVRPFFQPPMPAAPPAPGAVIPLFSGQSLANWRMAGRGAFHVVDGALQSVPSFDLGLLWCTIPMPESYRLELEFFTRLFETNSGVFVRFQNPESAGLYNPAWSAVTSGFEVQIDNLGRPDGQAKFRTGAVYDVNYAATAGDFVNPQNARVLDWNQLRIEVRGSVFTVSLNGVDTARFTNTDPNRGQFSPAQPAFVGLQSYSNYSYTTAFRNVRVTAL